MSDRATTVTVTAEVSAYIEGIEAAAIATAKLTAAVEALIAAKTRAEVFNIFNALDPEAIAVEVERRHKRGASNVG